MYTVSGPVIWNVQSLQHHMHGAMSCLEHIDAMQMSVNDSLEAYMILPKGQQLVHLSLCHSDCPTNMHLKPNCTAGPAMCIYLWLSALSSSFQWTFRLALSLMAVYVWWNSAQQHRLLTAGTILGDDIGNFAANTKAQTVLPKTSSRR